MAAASSCCCGVTLFLDLFWFISVDGMKVLHDLKHLRMMLVDTGLYITKHPF